MAAWRQPGGGGKQEQLAVVALAAGIAGVLLAAGLVVPGAADLAVDVVTALVAAGGVAVAVELDADG